MFTTIQGQAQSWTDINVTVDFFLVPILDGIHICDLSWTEKRTRGYQSSGGHRVYRTRGVTEYGANMTLYQSGARVFRTRLVEAAIQLGYVHNGEVYVGDVPFNVLVSWTPIGHNIIRVKRLKNCTVTDWGETMTEGTDPDKVSVVLDPLVITEIDLNGREFRI
jgi:hypothetical protein